MASDQLVRTYDPEKVIINFGGNPLSGYVDGTFISVKANSDLFTKKVGADGETARGRKHDNTHNVTLTLMQTSPSNTYLQTIENMDRLANLGIRPLSITDLSGGSLHFWPQAWINKDPDADYAGEPGERAWVFETGQSSDQHINGDFIPG